MIESVYKPRRRKNGKVSVARLYRGRYRLDGDIQVRDIALDTPDRQVALERLREIALQAQQEKEGLPMPRTQKGALRRKLAEHLDDNLADLKVMSRAETYLRLIRTRNVRLIKECKWAIVKDETTDRFVAWRSSQQDFAPKTLNEYLNAANGLMNWMVKQRRLESNSLRHVGLVEVRGKQQRRRALTAPGIERLDSVGRKVDFHALRYTFATKFARQGVPQRLAQELMRHSDPKLTVMIYTGVSQLPTFDAVQKLEWTAGKPAAEGQEYTQIDSQEAVSDSHERPRVDNENGVETWSQVVDVEGISQVWTGPDTNGQMVEAAGVEPHCTVHLFASPCTSRSLSASNDISEI